jgi:hypothetical protein
MTDFSVKKSYKEGYVVLRFDVKSSGWDPSVNVQGRANLSAAEARALASALIAEADKAAAKVAAKQASERRRQEWREREIAAGRMKVVSFNSLS